jgi:hypothetical protein
MGMTLASGTAVSEQNHPYVTLLQLGNILILWGETYCSYLNNRMFGWCLDLARLKISGVASQFATQISGIAYKPTSDLQFATQNYTQTNKKCEERLYKILFFRLRLCEKFRKSLHIEKKLLWALPFTSHFEPNVYWELGGLIAKTLVSRVRYILNFSSRVAPSVREQCFTRKGIFHVTWLILPYLEHNAYLHEIVYSYWACVLILGE